MNNISPKTELAGNFIPIPEDYADLVGLFREQEHHLATARAALAQCEERLKALTYEHSRLCRQFGDELRADEAAQRKEDIEAHEGQRMRDVLDYRMDNPCSDDFK